MLRSIEDIKLSMDRLSDIPDFITAHEMADELLIEFCRSLSRHMSSGKRSVVEAFISSYKSVVCSELVETEVEK